MPENQQISPSEITQCLNDFGKGNKDALDRLFPIVYNELRKSARRIRFQFYNLETFNTTAIVHETYIKLLQASTLDIKNRSHFFFITSKAMRQILVNASLRRRTIKRGENPRKLSIEDFDNDIWLSEKTSEDLILLNDALKKLEIQDERQASIVECRFFGGMSIEETGLSLNISPATVKRSWNLAKAWLYVELSEQ